MNFVNGIQIGGDHSYSPYAFGAKHVRRFIWVWLVKVIGFADHDKSGSKWNIPVLGPLSDGATDASDVSKFTSATGGFTSSMEGSFLVVHPTAAPATAGGFSDPKRNGFYRIKRVFDTNTISVETFNGVHADGLPLSESSLTFSVHDFRAAGDRPANGDWFVVRGTGVGGAYDIRFRETTSNYAGVALQASPFADWDASSHAWSPATRVTSEIETKFNTYADLAWIWAVGDLSQVTIWIRYYDTSWNAYDSQFIYLGDIVPFHASVDPKPIVVSSGKLGGDLTEYGSLSLRGLGSDDTSPVTYQAVYLSQQAGSGTEFESLRRTDRSRHSGRFVRYPVVLMSDIAGLEEIRGRLKNLEMGHRYGPRGPVPFGTNFDRIRFMTQMNAPWNGSKIHRYVY